MTVREWFDNPESAPGWAKVTTDYEFAQEAGMEREMVKNWQHPRYFWANNYPSLLVIFIRQLVAPNISSEVVLDSFLLGLGLEKLIRKGKAKVWYFEDTRDYVLWANPENVRYEDISINDRRWENFRILRDGQGGWFITINGEIVISGSSSEISLTSAVRQAFPISYDPTIAPQILYISRGGDWLDVCFLYNEDLYFAKL